MQKLVYFLDDEAEFGSLFKACFEDQQVKVEVFNLPADFFSACEKISPDVAFLDYRLPDTLGDEVARKIDKKIKKVLITGELQIKTSYPFEYIVFKPYKLQEIRDILEDVL